jgi:hypothetical protein
MQEYGELAGGQGWDPGIGTGREGATETTTEESAPWDAHGPDTYLREDFSTGRIDTGAVGASPGRNHRHDLDLPDMMMVADQGGHRDEPALDIGVVRVNPAPAEALTDAPAPVTEMPAAEARLDVEHVPEAKPDTPSAVAASAILRHVAADALAENREYADQRVVRAEGDDPTATLILERTADCGTVHVRVIGDHEIGYSIRPAEGQGQRHDYKYMAEPDGTVRRVEQDLPRLLDGLPPIGSVPEGTLRQILAARLSQQQEELRLEIQLGLNGKVVGEEEMRLVAEHVRGAEPPVLPYNKVVINLLQRVRLAEESPDPGESQLPEPQLLEPKFNPSDAEAAQAADSFIHTVLDFIEAQNHPDMPMTFQDKAGVLEVDATLTEKGPALRLSYLVTPPGEPAAGDAPENQPQKGTIVQYGLAGRAVAVDVTHVHPTHPTQTSGLLASLRDIRDLRHMLRRPRVR